MKSKSYTFLEVLLTIKVVSIFLTIVEDGRILEELAQVGGHAESFLLDRETLA